MVHLKSFVWDIYNHYLTQTLKNSSKVVNMRTCVMVVAFEVITEKGRPNIFIFEEGLKKGLTTSPTWK